MKRRRFPCLMYHKIIEKDDRKSNKYCVAPRAFCSQVSLLREHKIAGSDMADLLRRKYTDKAFPSNYCIITFEDGHESHLWAGNKLRENGFTATFFILKDKSKNRPDYLNINQIKMLHKMGHSIGVHGKTHRWWTALPDLELENELSETKRWLEDALGIPVEFCSPPGGKINNRVRNIIQKCGFVMWCTTWPAMNEAAKISNEINRIIVHQEDDLVGFIRKVKGYRMIYLKYQLRQTALSLPKFILKR